MYTARHAGRVTKGQVIFADPSAWRAAVSKHEGREVFVTVARVQHIHSSNQQRYYRGVVLPDYTDAYNEATGKQFSYPQMHTALVRVFVGAETDGPLEFVPSSSTFTVEQFTKLIDGARADALHRFGRFIPEPGQVEVL